MFEKNLWKSDILGKDAGQIHKDFRYIIQKEYVVVSSLYSKVSV